VSQRRQRRRVDLGDGIVVDLWVVSLALPDATGIDSLARVAEIGVVHAGGLAQGLALVSFPAAAGILSSADGCSSTGSQEGRIHLSPTA
jgi:hypothetical protein